VPKSVMRDEMTMAKASAMEPIIPPSVESPMSPPGPRACLGIGGAPYKQQDEQKYLDEFVHKLSPFISKHVYNILKNITYLEMAHPGSPSRCT
jgi:hypothetical protein